MFFTGSISSFSNSNVGAVSRWQNGNNWYKASMTGTQLVVQKRVNGTFTNLRVAAFKATANTAYSLRFRIVGTMLYAKVWASATTEPSAWTVTTTDSSLSSGQCGLRILISSGTSASVTSFLATTAS